MNIATVPEVGLVRDRLVARLKGFTHEMVPDPYNPITRTATRCKYCDHVSTHITCRCENNGCCLTRTKPWSTSPSAAWELWDDLIVIYGMKTIKYIQVAAKEHTIIVHRPHPFVELQIDGTSFADVVSNAWLCLSVK